MKIVTAPIRKKQIKRLEFRTCDKEFTSERRVERRIIIHHNTLVAEAGIL